MDQRPLSEGKRLANSFWLAVRILVIASIVTQSVTGSLPVRASTPGQRPAAPEIQEAPTATPTETAAASETPAPTATSTAAPSNEPTPTETPEPPVSLSMMMVERVSVSTAGQQGNGDSPWLRMSDDGRYVLFASEATSLSEPDSNSQIDIFLRDRQTGQTTRVNVGPNGEEANAYSDSLAISADGRYLAFRSPANNLGPSFPGFTEAVYFYDRQAETMEIINFNSAGELGNCNSGLPAISADGRFVAFQSCANNLVPGLPPDPGYQIYVRDRTAGTTQLVSVGTSGQASAGFNFAPGISADGRFVVFQSDAANLVPDDFNGQPDIFVPRYTLFPVSYFSENPAAAMTAISTFNARHLEEGISQTVILPPSDYSHWWDLRLWVAAGQLHWIDGTDPVLPLHARDVGAFPYGEITGQRANREFWQKPSENNTVFHL